MQYPLACGFTVGDLECRSGAGGSRWHGCAFRQVPGCRSQCLRSQRRRRDLTDDSVIVSSWPLAQLSVGEPRGIGKATSGAHIVIELTGKFRRPRRRRAALEGPRMQVLIWARADGAHLTLVLGVNDAD